MMNPRLLGVSCLAGLFLSTAWAADCPDRQPGRHLEYLGRSADSSVSFWLSAPGSAGTFRLSAPGVPDIDTWSARRSALHLTISPVVLDGPNGIHKLDRLNTDGSFNCFMDSRAQTNPVFPSIPPIGGGGSGGGNPIRNIVTNISAGALSTYQTGALSISDRVVVGLDRLGRFPQGDGNWQAWTEARHTGLSDDRNGIDASGHGNGLLVGVHRAFGSDLVAGFAAVTSTTRFGAFDSTVRNDTNGVFAGPYVGYRLTANWLLDGWAAWGRNSNDTQLAVLKGDFRTTTWFASANLTGSYGLGDFLFRPKLALFYSRNTSDAFDYTGTVPYAGGIYNVTLRVAKDTFEYATSELSGDISRVFATVGGTRIIPALRLGVRYDIERPNDGKILNGNLGLERTSPWSGSARLSLAIEPERNLRFEMATGYYSIGRQGLDLWDVRLSAAVSF